MVKQIDFEKSLSDLEEIIQQLENPKTGLEGSLAAFEKGVGIVKSCQKALDQAKNRVEILLGEDQHEQD
ncbi:MAG: exodeoxyribonuclease VII small subunit [Gammaproteobacteria bacterium]|jgi:exodeoxyribonuclease VII small subunit|nr:exodeoxyribonuclease VII small subunit [Gammaproteobacteria bacterium]